MRSTDKVLIGIVVSVVVLAGGAFAVMLLRPEQTYQGTDTPEGVAFNYFLALQREEYSRAYGYLSPYLLGYPASEARFEREVMDNYLFEAISESSFTIAPAEVKGIGATVEVREARFYGGGLFESGQYITTFEMELALVGGEWKIRDSEDYFRSCWNRLEGCP